MTERVETHQGVHHGGEDPAQTVLPVQSLLDESHRLVDGVALHRRREERVGETSDLIEREKEITEQLPGRVRQVASLLFGRRREQLAYADAARIARLRFERSQHE